MTSFEERFAAIGRVIDALIDRARAGRMARPYRSPRSRREFRDRVSSLRSSAGERASSAVGAVADWRRGLEGSGARRFNIAVILAAMVLTAAATWLWTRTFSTGLSAQEVQALSKIGREQTGARPPAPGGGPWWNSATTSPR